MRKSAKLGCHQPIHRDDSRVVWACAGIAGLTVAFAHGIWVAAVAAVFAFLVLRARVGIQARLLNWNQFATPWRAR